MIETLGFGNPDKLPLDKLCFYVRRNGVVHSIPALGRNWVVERTYTKYRSIPLVDGKVQASAELEEWKDEAQYFNKDMKSLLMLNHYRFWSNLLYERQCLVSITTFLQEATPSYLNLTVISVDDNVRNIYEEIMENVFRVITRMITSKEAEDEWITKEHLQKMLYEKDLISIPMIFDIIIAYGRSNTQALENFVKTIFQLEPKYNDDLKTALEFYQNHLRAVQFKTANEDMPDGDSPGISLYEDIAMYVLDCATSLNILLDIYPPARRICGEIQMEHSISNFYDSTIPKLYTKIYLIDTNSHSLAIVDRARLDYLLSFRSIVSLHLEEAIENPERNASCAEKYICTLTECLADRTFVIDYQQNYPVRIDIEVLKLHCKELDTFRADWVLRSYQAEADRYVREIRTANPIVITALEDGESAIAGQSTDTPQVVDNVYAETNCPTPPIDERNMQVETMTVRDVLPHLSDGFIRRLLLRYENPELAIAAVLEGNLPPDLSEADQTEVYIPPDPQDTLYVQTGVTRFNVYDGDKYDVMTQDKPQCIIKKGKGLPGEPKNMAQLLDDKAHIKEMKERYQEYSLVTDDNEYDDEYDDSYEALAEAEVKTQQLLKELEAISVEGSSSDDSDDADLFCQDPEAIRAKYEVIRNARIAKKSTESGQKSKGNSAPDVVGKPKGQGQDKNVANARRKKDVHKATRANHNRKDGAAWKRNRGGFT